MSMASSVQPAGQDSAFFDFMAQTVVSRRSFLAEHPSLEELALAKMMPGRLWPRLVGDLPHDVLPNLRHLQCAPHQATALLQNPHPCLKTLLGINLHTEFRECDYFSSTDKIFFKSIEDEEDFRERTRHLLISPWRDMLFRGLESHRTITRLEVTGFRSVQKVAEIAVIAPQTSEISFDLDVYGLRKNRVSRTCPFIFHLLIFVGTRQETELFALYALFPALEVVNVQNLMGIPIALDETDTDDLWTPMNNQVQALVRACPGLRVIRTRFNWKLVIIRDEQSTKLGGVKWVMRHWKANEKPVTRNSERVEGP